MFELNDTAILIMCAGCAVLLIAYLIFIYCWRNKK